MSAKFTDLEETHLVVTLEGIVKTIRVDDSSAEYRRVKYGRPAVMGVDAVGNEIEIAPAIPPMEIEAADVPDDHLLMVSAVRGECQRRMIALTGARDASDLDVKISNGNREAIRLLRKGEENWTPEEATRAAELEAVDAAIEVLRSSSNVLEEKRPVPTDFKDDKHWNVGQV